MPEWLKGADCKSVGLRLRWFESIPPRTLAIARKGSPRWIRAETEYLEANFPWYELVGKFGWVCLAISVALQLAVVTGSMEGF